MVTEPISRPAARVLVVDAAGRVLLLHGFDPACPEDEYWLTPGGGIDPPETPAQAAARELYEETGLLVDPGRLGPVVYSELVDFPFDGSHYRAEQSFFLLRVQAWQASATHLTEVELRSVLGHRWWTIEELESTEQRYYPEDLPMLLRELVVG